jgi:hypothetical protein
LFHLFTFLLTHWTLLPIPHVLRGSSLISKWYKNCKTLPGLGPDQVWQSGKCKICKACIAKPATTYTNTTYHPPKVHDNLALPHIQE